MMKTLYKILLMAFYYIGLILIWATTFARICFYVNWTIDLEITTWSVIIFIFLCRYSLLVLGDKLKYLSLHFLYVLKNTGVVFGILLLVFVALLFIVTEFFLSFEAPFAMVVASLVEFALTILVHEKLYKKYKNYH